MRLVINGDEMTIHLYSDSFGESHWEKGHWPFELAEMRQQKLYANGNGGTGPNWSLKKLIRDYECKKIKNFDVVIVLLSDQKRMEFPWLHNEKLSDGIFLLAEDIQKDSKLNIYLKGGEITEDSTQEEIQTHIEYDKTRYSKYKNDHLD